MAREPGAVMEATIGSAPIGRLPISDNVRVATREGQHRVGVLGELPSLLAEFGVYVAQIAAAAGLDGSALCDPERPATPYGTCTESSRALRGRS